jgi:hypothetical protein
MKFSTSVSHFVRGNYHATLLRVVDDGWLGLVQFDDFGVTEWVNAAFFRSVGWRPK